MPFIYKPSLWGFGAAAVFIVMTIITVQDSEWVHAAMWGLLSISFITKYMPKLIVFGPPAALFSFVTLVAGGAMFIVYANDMIGNG